MSRLEILKELCKAKGISINKLEQELGFSQGSLGKIDSSVPKADKLYAIAKFFGTPMEIFFEDAADKRVAHYTEQLIDVVEKYKEPVYDVAAGNGRVNGDYTDTYIEEDEGQMEGYSWCEVHGDSMYPTLLDGDLVRVEHMTQTEPTDLTVIKVDGESATVKHVEVADNGIWLRAENKDAFEDRFYSVQDVLSLPVTIVGKVVELKRKF